MRSVTALLLGLAVFNVPVRASHEQYTAVFRHYYRSVSRCTHGQRIGGDGVLGVLILFRDELSRTAAVANLTSILHHSGDAIDASFSSFPGFAASLTVQTISELLAMQPASNGWRRTA